jgi:hypothetical protein
MSMIPFHTVCTEVAMREVRSARVAPGPDGLDGDEFAFVEFYCDDLACDCRRVFLEVWSKARAGEIVASINFGWESRAFYRQRMPYPSGAAREIVEGSLDLLNQQSELAPELLKLFQEVVANQDYKARLQRHYELFRRTLRKTRGASF